MKNKILKTMQKHHMLEKGMHIVIGLSGGPDSMCMFDVFCRLAETWQLKLHPVHVNHKFRPGAAEEDQAFAEDWCREKGWPCRTFVRDCNAVAAAEGLTSEEAGRKVRYEAFRTVAGEIADGGIPRTRIAIAVGQNAEDQCETLLFRLLRGTGVDGLAGIAYKRWDEDGNAVIRPILDCSRQEIENYCRQQNLQPRRDHTNEEPIYMRNRIRLELIPYLQKEFNPNLTETLHRLASAASQDADYIHRQAEDAWRQAVVNASEERAELSTEVLMELHRSIRIRLYNRALEHTGLKENISAAHLDGVEAVLFSDSPSAIWNLPEGYRAEKRYDRICFYNVSKFVEPEKQTSQNTINSSGVLKVRVSAIDDAGKVHAPDTSAISAQFDLQALEDAYGKDAAGKIVLRTREDGDYMVIFTGGGLHRKKLQDLLVDMKIPKSTRGQLQLAAIGKEVLWILPPGKTPGKKPDETEHFGRLGRNGRVSAAYKSGEESGEMRIVLEYLVRV